MSREIIDTDQLNLTSDWYRAKQKLDHYKKLELDLRKEVIEICFNNEKKVGSQTFSIGEHGHKIKCSKSQKKKVDQTLLRQCLNKLPEELLDWKASIVEKEYKTLAKDQLKLIDDCIEIVDNSPSLKIIEPKS